MVEEIIYTSAEKGLKQGSRGFCTVVSTSGMALNIAERLESMSGYRHAFPLNDPRSSLNPVNYSHVTMRLAGKNLHILSRVADAGQDYTGRSNKLAHHIVLGSVAHLLPGPARLLEDTTVIVDRWDGVVRHIAPRELQAPAVPSTIQLSAWKAICGDGGWAGSVAEQLLQNPAPVSVIFAAGIDTLSLVREVLDLVPAPQRWNVTFSTYFTRLLAGADCQLRFVLNETPEATALRNDARARVVDLTKSLQAATGGALVATARSGQLIPQEPEHAATAERVTRTVILPKENISVPPPKASVVPLPPRIDQPSINPTKLALPEIPLAANRRRSKTMLAVVLLFLATLIGVAVTTVMLLGTGKPDRFSEIMANSVPAEQSVEDRNEAVEADRDAAEAKRKEDEARIAEAAEVQRKEEEGKKQRDAEAEKTRLAEEKSKAKEAEMEEANREKEGPFAFIRKDETRRDSHGQWLFELPAVGKANETEPLLPLRVNDNDQTVKLAFFAGAEHLFAGSTLNGSLYRLTLDQLPENPDKWIAKAAFGTGAIELAEYTIEPVETVSNSVHAPNRQIRFKWLVKNNVEPASKLLRWWPLEIHVGDRTAVLLQRSAFRPDTKPTWNTLIESNKFNFATDDEIETVALDKATDISFDVVITQKDHPEQRVGEKHTARPTDDRNLRSRSHDVDAHPKSATKYFQLKLPFELTDEQPSVDDHLLGFGTLQITTEVGGTSGISMNSDMQLTLRLPKQDLITTFPSPGLLSTLDSLSKEPTGFSSVAGQITFPADDPKTGNNEKTGWPNMQQKYKNEIDFMTSNVEACRMDVSYWFIHRPFKSIPEKKAFSSPFAKKAKKAVSAIENVIPGLQEKARQTGIASDHAAYQKALSYKTAVTKYGLLMTLAMREVDKQIQSLLEYYDRIEVRIKEFDDASKRELFQVHCEVSGLVATPGSDSGENLRVYFLESTSDAAH